MNEVIWQRNDCVSTEVEDSLVVLDLQTLLYHSLNETAAAVWQSLEEPRDTETIVEQVCGRYDISVEQCRASVTRLLSELETKGLITSRTNAAS